MVRMIKKYRRAVSAVVVVGTILGLLFFWSKVLVNKGSYQKYNPFYKSDLAYDVLFFGSSHVYSGISPLWLWHNYGITSYNMGYDSCSVANSYWSLRRAVEKGKKPEIAVVDVYDWLDGGTPAAIAPSHGTLDYFSLDLEKIKAVTDLFPKGSVEREKLLFPFSEYHNRWKELTAGDIFPQEIGDMGQRVRHTVAPPDKVIIRDRENKVDAGENLEKYLRLLSEFCRAEGIKLLLINIPYSYNPELQKRANGVYQLAEALKIPYINYMNEEAVDFDIHFYDIGHLNTAGGHRMTDIVAGELLKLGAADRRGETQAQRWNTYYKEYVDSIFSSLENCSDIKTYLSTLACLDAEAAMSYDENGEALLEDETIKKLVEALGSRCTLNPCSVIMRNETEVNISITVRDKESGEAVDRAYFTAQEFEGVKRL